MVRTRRSRDLLLAGLGAFALALHAESGKAGGLTIAHPFAEGSEVDVWVQGLSKCIGERFGIPAEILGGGFFSSSEELRDATLKGQFDLVVLPLTTLAQDWPALRLLVTPGAVSSPDEVMRLSQSKAFIELLNQLSAEVGGLHVLAIGWQYQVLAYHGEVPDDLGGQKIRSFGEQYAQLFSRFGAEQFAIPSGEVGFALSFGAIDGAIVRTEEIKSLQETSKEPLTLYWSDNYTPLTSPIALTMSGYSEQNWGKDLVRVIQEDCAEVTQSFNQQSIETAFAAVRDAEASGAVVRPLDEPRWSEVVQKVFDETTMQSDSAKWADMLRQAKAF
jgi:TRAP-type C4-dicarboxylate transport system substrate-binding protein